MTALVRSHEKRRWLFEEPTQSQISTSILKYTTTTRPPSTRWNTHLSSNVNLERSRPGGAALAEILSSCFVRAMCSVSEVGSYLRLIDSCITQLKAQGPSRTCRVKKSSEGVRGSAQKKVWVRVYPMHKHESSCCVRGGDVQRFRGGLIFKAHRLCVSLNSRLERNKEEEEEEP